MSVSILVAIAEPRSETSFEPGKIRCRDAAIVFRPKQVRLRAGQSRFSVQQRGPVRRAGFNLIRRDATRLGGGCQYLFRGIKRRFRAVQLSDRLFDFDLNAATRLRETLFGLG